MPPLGLLDLNHTERTFLKLCCSERTFREIAAEMGKSPRTIDGYRDDLLLRLNLKNRTGLVLWALKHNVISLHKIKL